jgi:membrane-associated phospholipid phosphatase
MTARVRALLTAAALDAMAFFGLYALAYEWHAGGQLDGRALLGFSVIRVSIVTHAAHFFQSLCDPTPYLVMCVVLVAIVLTTRGVVLTGAVVAVLVASNASTRALKPLIASASGFHVGPLATVGVGSFPSGHSTAAMALACAIVIAAPSALRPLAALASGLFVLAISWSALVLSSHLPSDLMGGYLVASFWAFIVLAGLCVAARRRPRQADGSRRGWAGRAPVSLTTAASALVTIGGVAVILAVIRLRPAATRASSLIDFGVVAVVMTLLLAALISVVAAFASAPRSEAALPGDRFRDR